MKQWKGFLLIACIFISNFSYSQPGGAANWNLVFEDEFNGTTLDQTKWGYNYPWGRTHNHRAYMTDSMVTFKDGIMTIKAINKRHPSAPDGTNQYQSSFGYLSFDYTSGAIHSKGKFETTYGYIEGRFKAPATHGSWPAFWTLNGDGAWPPEIDILEIPDDRRVHHYYYHYGPDWQNESSFGATHTGADKSQGFHTYGVEWGPNYMKFYYDGQLLNSYTGRSEASQGRNMYLLINLAIDGWAPTPNANAVWPALYQCDWVRVWKMNPNANFDFETGNLSPWGPWNNATITQDCRRSGNHGVKLTGSPVSIERTVILEPNTRYVFGGYGRVNTSGESVMFGVKNYGGNQIVKQVTSTSFIRDSVVFTTGASNASAVIFYYKDAGNGSACGDDFFLYKANTNPPPVISITSPANNAVFVAPASITINAQATDANGTVSNVQFYNGTTLLGSDGSSPYSFVWNNVATGTYALTARATDNNGAVATSSAITVHVNATCTPTVITPYVQLNGGAWAAGSSASLHVGGSVIMGPHPLDVGSWSWSGPNGFNATSREITLTNIQTNQAGNYLATYTNSIGCNSTSTFTVNVSPINVAPTVSITSPVNNASFTAPTSITIHASAADTDGTVSTVQFYNGATLLGSDASSPYSYTWNNVAAGTYTITARATDNAGAVTTSSAITIVVDRANAVPTVSITSPANNASFTAPTNITINASVADSDGSVSTVQFYNGATLLGSDASSSYSYTWSNVAAGTYTITAKATDNAGAVTTSAAITIVVDPANAVPTVSITSPANEATFIRPASIPINVAASDPDGSVSKVEFFSGSTKIGEDISSPFSYAWNNVAEGTYTIIAKATDNAGAITTSSSITVIVQVPANISPSVSITSPANNATFTEPENITITANASDVDGTVSGIEFFNGTVLLGTDVSSPYSFTWLNARAGSYTITARATDNAGAFTSSNPITITVNDVPVNQAPEVSIISPVHNASFTEPASIVFNATASDVDGTVNGIEFFNGTVLLGSDNTSPYSFTWINVAEGSYIITARATDNLGSISNSLPVTVTVNAGNPTGVGGPTNSKSQATIYPNPTTSTLTLTVREEVLGYTIINSLGQEVLIGGAMAGGASIEFGQDLASGFYTLTIEYANGKIETRKIQKVI